MGKLVIKTAPEVSQKFDSYPPKIKSKLNALRSLIIETATEIGTIKRLEEALKWGEPSYLVKKGSTIRIDWKPKTPDYYAMYFKCTSKLVPTFKALFGHTFTYEKTRAIRFKIEEEIPKDALKVCIELALKYHTVKDKPLLGMEIK